MHTQLTSAVVQQYLRRLTGGHIGYLTGLLSGLRELRRSNKDSDPEALYLSTLANPGEVLKQCRFGTCNSHFSRQLNSIAAPSSNDNNKALLKVLLFKWDGLSHTEAGTEAKLGPAEIEKAKITLCHAGYLVETKDHKLQLTARVLHFYLAQILYVLLLSVCMTEAMKGFSHHPKAAHHSR